MVGIKDFGMPSCCQNCDLWQYNRNDEPKCNITLEKIFDFNERNSDCPLVAIDESNDCVSRAELLKALDTWDKFGVDDTGHLFRLDNLSYPHYEPYIHYRDVIKAVKGMPSVQPNREKHDEEIIKKTVESIWGKPPYTEVLDAIRAEIEQYKADCDLTCSDDSNCRTCNNITFGTIYQIIDKYRKGQTDADSD